LEKGNTYLYTLKRWGGLQKEKNAILLAPGTLRMAAGILKKRGKIRELQYFSVATGVSQREEGEEIMQTFSLARGKHPFN